MSEPIDQPTGYVPHGPVVIEGQRLVLLSEVLFGLWVAAMQEHGTVLTVDWGEPRTEVVTFHVPVVTAVPSDPAQAPETG